MIVTSSLDGPGSTPEAKHGTRLVASLDVEWTKNYRTRNANRVFCYSMVWLEVPDVAQPVDLADQGFSFTSVYVDDEDECHCVVEQAASDLQAAIQHASLLVGHQLCSDLALLAANSAPPVPVAVEHTRLLWRQRDTSLLPRIIDTRFDVGEILTGRSRRLVDVCAEVGLDVAQPELGRKSMTALHRDWLAGDHEARERITVMNLRHSLSATLVALRAQGWGTWTPVLNVNRLLDTHLAGTFGWLNHPIFRGLL